MGMIIYIDADDLPSLRAALAEMKQLEDDVYLLAQLKAVHLSRRECELLFLDAKGLKRRCIAEHLVISERTVEKYWENIYIKTGLHNRQHVRIWMKHLYAESDSKIKTNTIRNQRIAS